jgi:hypothetical protein
MVTCIDAADQDRALDQDQAGAAQHRESRQAMTETAAMNASNSLDLVYLKQSDKRTHFYTSRRRRTID